MHVVGRALVVPLEVALHAAVDAEVVLLEVPGAPVVVVKAAAVRGVVGDDEVVVQARVGRLRSGGLAVLATYVSQIRLRSILE